MTTTIHVHPKRGVGVVRFTGTVEYDTLREAVDALIHRDAWLPDYDVIWDWRDVSTLIMSSEELDALIDNLHKRKPQLGDGRCAIVAERDMDRHFAQLVMLKDPDCPRERHLFDSVGAAARWLEADEVLA